MASEAAGPAVPVKTFSIELDDALARQVERITWRDRLLNGWTPALVLAVLFILYVGLIGFSECAYLWAMVPLRVLAGVCTLWALVAIGATYVPTAYSRLRKSREHADALYEDVVSGVRKAKVDDKARAELERASVELYRAYVGTDLKALNKAIEVLSHAADKQLKGAHKSTLVQSTLSFAMWLFIALFIRTVFLEPYSIPSGSMIPTLEIGDRVFINKFIYGIRIPGTDIVPFVIVRPPKRGDVIVFHNPIVTDKDYIKRVIGVPGDVIEVKDKVIFVNQKPLSSDVEAEAYTVMERQGDDRPWFEVTATLFRERIDGRVHLALRDPEDPSGITEGPFEVPPGKVFVMGDNRDNSEDSRYGLGGGRHLGVQYVPYGNIKGKAMVTWLSLSHGGLFASFFGGTGLRIDRLFLPVDMCGSEPARAMYASP